MQSDEHLVLAKLQKEGDFDKLRSQLSDHIRNDVSLVFSPAGLAGLLQALQDASALPPKFAAGVLAAAAVALSKHLLAVFVQLAGLPVSSSSCIKSKPDRGQPCVSGQRASITCYPMVCTKAVITTSSMARRLL